MANTSASGGYLTPTTPPPDYDRILHLDLQGLVVGITGMAGELVRRRWQLKPPPQPEADINWCAIGVLRISPEAGLPAFLHVSTEDGHDNMQRHETLEIMASFYGPMATGYATLLRDGLTVAQNREALFARGMGYIDTDALINASQMQNSIWVPRIDLTFRLRRRIDRNYAVQNVKEAVGAVHTSGGSVEGSAGAALPFEVTGD